MSAAGFDGAGALEQLRACSRDAEIWWDSSPLVFRRWFEETIAGVEEERRAPLRTRLARLFDPERPEGSLVCGATTNPILSAAVLQQDPATWTPRIAALARDGHDEDALFRAVYCTIVRAGAAVLEPLWRATEGQLGWLSAQVDPRRAFDAEAMLSEGLELAALAPNVMVKIPGTAEGYAVIEELASRAISINNTLTYSTAQLAAYAEATRRGLDRARRDGLAGRAWRAVFTFMTGRCGSQGTLGDQARDRGRDLEEMDVRWAEVAIAKRMHDLIERERWPVKLLLSSMRATTCEDRSACLHLEETGGGAIVYTCPPSFIRDVLQREERMTPIDPDAIHRPVPARAWSRFGDLPYFRACYEADELRPRSFNHFTPLLATLGEFVRAHERARDFVRRAAASGAAGH